VMTPSLKQREDERTNTIIECYATVIVMIYTCRPLLVLPSLMRYASFCSYFIPQNLVWYATVQVFGCEKCTKLLETGARLLCNGSSYNGLTRLGPKNINDTVILDTSCSISSVESYYSAVPSHFASKQKRKMKPTIERREISRYPVPF